MDIAAEPPMGRPAEAPELHGQRIDWTPRDVLFGAFWFIFLFILAPLPFVLPFVLATDNSDSSEVFGAALVTSMFSQAALVAVAAFFTFRKYGGSWDRLGFRTPTWGTAGWAVAALVAAFAWAAAYGGIVTLFDLDSLKAACDEQVPVDVQNNAALLALASVIFVSFAPVCEETFFRGFVFPGLMRWGVPVAVVVSAGLFSIAHASVKAFVPILGIGMIFALTYFKSGNILSTILAHFAYNCISVSTLWAGDCEPS
jgi:membrane protease YdiL (CAAX protease family)